MIELMGPPAGGKTALCARAHPTHAGEPLVRIRDAGTLPEPGIARQRMLLFDLAGEDRCHTTAPVLHDVGAVSVLAFAAVAHGRSAAAALLGEAVTRFGIAWLDVHHLLWVDAPPAVLRARAAADLTRRRIHLEQNLAASPSILREVERLFELLPAERVHRIDTSSRSDWNRALTVISDPATGGLGAERSASAVERWLS